MRYGPEPSSEIEGSSAYIYTNYQSGVCGTDTRKAYNFVTSWDMVYDTHNDNLSQAGTFWRYADPCVYAFVEQHHNGEMERSFWYCLADGSQHSYRNLMEGDPYRIAAYIDGVPFMVSDYDPLDDWTFPVDIAFMGEATYVESDIPGTPTAKENFTEMGVQRFDNDALVTTCGNAKLATYWQIPNRYATDSVSCKFVRTWTKSPS